MKENHKDITLKGRTFRVNKFDALTGSFIAYQLLTGMMPGGMDAQLGNMPTGRAPMGRDQFTYIQTECLKVCFELTTVGPIVTPLPVLLANGSFGVPELEYDTLTVIGLTINALVHNVSGFFDEGALKELTGTLAGMNPFNAPT